jgi:hypothetical protein
MTPVRFNTNLQQRTNGSVRGARTGLAAASRNLKFIFLPRSSAKAV